MLPSQQWQHYKLAIGIFCHMGWNWKCWCSCVLINVSMWKTHQALVCVNNCAWTSVANPVAVDESKQSTETRGCSYEKKETLFLFVVSPRHNSIPGTPCTKKASHPMPILTNTVRYIWITGAHTWRLSYCIAKRLLLVSTIQSVWQAITRRQRRGLIANVTGEKITGEVGTRWEAFLSVQGLENYGKIALQSPAHWSNLLISIIWQQKPKKYHNTVQPIGSISAITDQELVPSPGMGRTDLSHLGDLDLSYPSDSECRVSEYECIKNKYTCVSIMKLHVYQ